MNTFRPLADRMRPDDLEDYLGQAHILGEGKLLRQVILSGALPSMIFWGPPGTGKTTLANIIAKRTQAVYLSLSAVTAGVKDLKALISEARSNQIEDKQTILFVDEIHRWNKAQQDALLPHVEKGTIILIGATTENPSFEIRNALLSRCRVFVLEALTSDDLRTLVKRTLTDTERGLGGKLEMGDEAIDYLAERANGDARLVLNVLEYLSAKEGLVSREDVAEALQKTFLLYDKNGDEHYNVISALHKSMRGSDADAAIYWLTRMLEGGEDPLYIARRLVRFASEDIGLANSRALEQAVAAYQACHFIGMPECGVVLAQAVVYLAKCRKSNALYSAYRQAQKDATELANLPVPIHLRNAPTILMKELNYGVDYKYSPDYDYQEKQDYMPNELKGRRYGLDKIGD